MTLAEAFTRSGGKPIEYNGQAVQLSHWVPVVTGDQVTLRFLQAAPRPIQGVGITTEKCQLHVAGILSRNIGLWRDTAPDIVEITVSKASRGARIGFMNQWRDEVHGATLLGMNNAGMMVQAKSEVCWLLRCSDGWEGPNFDDLVVEITLHRTPALAAGTAPVSHV